MRCSWQITVESNTKVFDFTNSKKYITIHLKISAESGRTNVQNATLFNCDLQLPIIAPCSYTIKSKLLSKVYLSEKSHRGLYIVTLWQYAEMLCKSLFWRATTATAVARLSHRSSVRMSVRLSVTRVDQSKTVRARITKSLPSTAWRTLVSGSVKLFYKFERDYLY